MLKEFYVRPDEGWLTLHSHCLTSTMYLMPPTMLTLIDGRTLLVQHGYDDMTMEDLDPSWAQADLLACCHPEALPKQAKKKHVLRDHVGELYLTTEEIEAENAYTVRIYMPCD